MVYLEKSENFSNVKSFSNVVKVVFESDICLDDNEIMELAIDKIKEDINNRKDYSNGN